MGVWRRGHLVHRTREIFGDVQGKKEKGAKRKKAKRKIRNKDVALIQKIVEAPSGGPTSSKNIHWALKLGTH